MKRTLISLAYAAILLASVTALGSCKREPLHEPFSNYYLQLVPDFSAIHIKPSEPRMYEAVFYDKTTHREVGQSYLGSEGGYIYDLAPGTYELLIYAFDSGNTVVSGLGTFTGAMATTELYESGIYNAPDHLMVARDTCFTIPFLYDREEAEILYAYPKTIMDTWCVVVDGIEGLENAVSIDFYVSGQSETSQFGMGTLSYKPHAIHFPGDISADGKELYTPFCTIGKLPNMKSNLQLVIMDPNQQQTVCQAEVTDQFDDPENTGHWIRLHFDAKIEPKKDGGMQPVVEPWNDNVFEYDIH